MAQAVQRGQVTPADELRDLLDTAEKRVANVKGSGEGAVTLLKELDRIAELWPQLEAAGMDLRPEAGRWETLQAAVQRRAATILAELQGRGGIDAVRKQLHPGGTDAPWWRLDETLAQNRRKTLRRSLVAAAIVVVFAVGAYLILRSLTDPKVMESSRRVSNGEQAVQQRGDWPAALAEFQAASTATPNDPDVWLHIGIANEQLKNPDAAKSAFDRARSLLPSDLEFYKARSTAYFVFGLIDQAEADVKAALALKNDDAQSWYMMASVYEARDQVQQAIDALNKASTYAEATNQSELVALSRYRMGMLMQRGSLPQDAGTPGLTPTP